MSGRIYDGGINPKCDICGSRMWTSTERNFNGCQCKRKGCKGNPIYKPFDTNYFNDVNIKLENGKYILEGVFQEFDKKTTHKSHYNVKLRKYGN